MHALVIMLPLSLRRGDQLSQSFSTVSYCLRRYGHRLDPSDPRPYEATYVYCFRCGLITRAYLYISLSVGFNILVSRHVATQLQGLTFTLVGLVPTEHASLFWTHAQRAKLIITLIYWISAINCNLMFF